MAKTIHLNTSGEVEKQNCQNSMLPQNAETTMESLTPLMQQVVRWLIHSGVGYTEFIGSLKPIFYKQALLELEHLAQKQTDSAISLISGLHRKDVVLFKKETTEYQADFLQALPISVPARVIGRWIALNLPSVIPFTGQDISFETLVKDVSTEKHPRSILLELERLSVVKEREGNVFLQQKSFTPDLKMQESKALFSQNITDHMRAGIDNFINQHKNFTHLEQAVFADKLSQESVKKLRQLSCELWEEMAQKLVNQAIAYCEEDQDKPEANKRFRLGVYQYDEDMP